MEKIKDFIKNKKNIVIISSVILLIIVAGTLTIFISHGFKNGGKKLSEEETLKLYLEEFGRDFYEQKYQPYMSKDILGKFTDLGIKFNLDGLLRVNADQNAEKVSAFVNSKTKEECDKENSMAIIYPQEPYGEKDYRIEVVLSCGFDKK